MVAAVVTSMMTGRVVGAFGGGAGAGTVSSLVFAVMVVVGEDRSGVVRFEFVRVNVDLLLDFVTVVSGDLLVVGGDHQCSVGTTFQVVVIVQDSFTDHVVMVMVLGMLFLGFQRFLR